MLIPEKQHGQHRGKRIMPVSFLKHCKFNRRATTYICLVRHTLDYIFVKLLILFLATIWEGFL